MNGVIMLRKLGEEHVELAMMLARHDAVILYHTNHFEREVERFQKLEVLKNKLSEDAQRGITQRFHAISLIKK